MCVWAGGEREREKGERMRERDDDKLGRKMKPRRAGGMQGGPH